MPRTTAHISPDERAEALASAVDLGRTAIGEGRGFIPPNARIGSLSAWEWNQLAMSVVSGWIAARGRQLVGDRFLDESLFLATGEVPEPAELGRVEMILPGLGELVTKLGLAEQPIGAWPKEHVALFVWTAADTVAELRARIDERPEPANDGPSLGEELMAG